MKTQRKIFLSLALAVLCVGSSGILAAADLSFERLYGHDKDFEQALKGAVAVQNCPGEGYVSVGFSRHTDTRADSDVYAVRVGQNGATIWERTIDIGHFSNDVGTSVRELFHSSTSGFVVTGTTAPQLGADRDIFLLKLNCDGSLAWVQRIMTRSDLREVPTDDVANDVIEADTGVLAPVGSPRQGDLIVAGFSRRPVGSVFDTDAYLVRTDPSGNVIWSRTYSNWGQLASNPLDREWFNAVGEALPTSGQLVGDILAAGAQADTGWEDGLAVRVSGTDGRLSLPLHTMASFGVSADGAQERPTELWAIRELHQAGMEYLNIVAVGNIADDGGATEGYAAKTGPDLNVRLAERVIGDGFEGAETEGFADVIEITSPTGYASAGDLAVTGYATIHDNQDVTLLALSAGTLTPVAGTGNVFGDHADGEERGTALSQVQPVGETERSGIYINGFTRSDPLRVSDPEDMYLIKTSAAGETACSEAWHPADFSDEPEVCICGPVDEDPRAFNVSVSSSGEYPSWASPICQ
jgi:hypothetical protein